MNVHVASLLEKEMDRKEFLVFLGIVLLAVTGISGFLKTTTHALNTPQKAKEGYGASPYGK